MGVPLLRRILSRGASLAYRLAFDLPEVRDYSCGYRLFRAGLIQQVLKERGTLGLENGFQATGELLLRLREKTDRITEVPFHLHYERKPTASKMRKLQTILGTIRFLVEVRKTVRSL
jgi:dolichol-phosphate mannosyltransferase